MNDAMELADLESEPFEIESTSEEYEEGEAGGDFEYSEEADGEFDMEAGAPQSAQRRPPPARSPQMQQALQRHRALNTNFVKAIGTLNRHVVKQGGIYRFTLPARSANDVASKLRLPPNAVQLLLGSLKQKNARLRAARTTQAELELEAPACAGRTAVTSHWWGQKIWLNECHTKTAISALKAAAAGGGGCAALAPHPVVKIACGAFGAIAGVSGYLIEAIDSLGGNQGIIVYRPWLSGGWVWHQ